MHFNRNTSVKGLNVQPIDGRQSYGLFGYVAWGVVKNLGIVGGTVTSKADDGQEYTGAISGMLSYGRIENCFSTATVSGTAEGSIGGLTGGMRDLRVRYPGAEGKVAASADHRQGRR